MNNKYLYLAVNQITTHNVILLWFICEAYFIIVKQSVK